LAFFGDGSKREKVLKWSKADKLEKWREDLTEVCENVFVGSATVAGDAALLERNGITHSVNCASQVVNSLSSLLCLDIAMNDGGDENILSHIWSTTVFIEDALAAQGKVLVHCVEGVSRSIAVVIGFLILTRRMSYTSAFGLVRQKRRVASPHPKFIAQLQQLCEILGSAQVKTCFFSREKVLPFEIVIRRGAPVAIPAYGHPQLDEDRTFVIVDFRNAKEDGRGGKIEVRLATDAPSEIADCAKTVAAHVSRILDISPGVD
jgi:hypothetical protein